MRNEGEIKVISECFIRPQHEVESAKQRYHLGPCDLKLLCFDPIQKGLLFRFETDMAGPKIESLVEKLKRALSIALVHFYPLAGRFETIKYEDEHACLIFIDCFKGPGARLIHASADLTVSNILSSIDVHPAVRSFFDIGEKMVNYDGHTKALLSIQVTELMDGVFIGFTMNHSVVDGTSFILFVRTLSDIFRSLNQEGENPIQILRLPLYKMYAPEGIGPVFKLSYLEPEEFVVRYDPGPLRERIFHFSPESMASLKAKANEECGSGTQVISSFMALSGLVWRSITRAQDLAAHEKTYCMLLLNARPRLNPPLSEDFFGNFLTQIEGLCTVEELLGQSFGRAAMVLAQEGRKITHEIIMNFLKTMSDYPFVCQPGLPQADVYAADTKVTIGGGHRFDMYGPDFGMGRAVAVRMGFANKDNGKVTANPGREGGGSVDLEICLKPKIMKALEEDEEFMSYVSMN